MKQMQGDLITLAEEGVFDVIVHGCNCFNTMGVGIAKQIKERYPETYRIDCTTNRGDVTKLGGYTWQRVNNGQFVIINAYIQYNYGKGRHVDYGAISKVFNSIAIHFNGIRIGYPRIGAGLAGGNWNVIKGLIDEALGYQHHTLVTFK